MFPSGKHRGALLGVLVPLAFLMMATRIAAPAYADTGVDAVLNGSGTAAASPTGTTVSSSLGESICAAMLQPGQTMTSIASALTAQDGTTPPVSKLLTGLAVSIYCPTKMSSLAGADWLGLLGGAGP